MGHQGTGREDTELSGEENIMASERRGKGIESNRWCYWEWSCLVLVLRQVEVLRDPCQPEASWPALCLDTVLALISMNPFGLGHP